MVLDWLEWLIKVMSDPDYLHYIAKNKTRSNQTFAQDKIPWKPMQRQEVQKALAGVAWFLLICICICYVASSYFRRQVTLAQKLGKFKSQVAIFGRQNNELSKELMQTKSQLALAEHRLMNKDSSIANVLEMTRLRAELESVRIERSALLQRLQGGRIAEIRSWSSERMVEDSRHQGTRALELKLRVRESETNAMKQQLETAKKEADTMRLELEALRKETAPSFLAQRLQTLLGERTKAAAEIEELQAVIKSNNKLLDDARTELSAEVSKNEGLNQKNLEFELKLKNLIEEKELMEARLSEITTEKNALERRLTLIEQEIWSDDRSEATTKSETVSKKDVGEMGDMSRDSGNKQEIFTRMKQTLHKVDALMSVSKNKKSTPDLILPGVPSATEEEEQWCDTIEGQQEVNSIDICEQSSSQSFVTKSSTTQIVCIGNNSTEVDGELNYESEFREDEEGLEKGNTGETDVRVQIIEIETQESAGEEEEEEEEEEEGQEVLKIGNIVENNDTEDTGTQNFIARVTTIPEEDEEVELEEESDEESEEEEEYNEDELQEEEEEEEEEEDNEREEDNGDEDEDEEEGKSSEESSQLSDTSSKNLSRFFSSSRPVSGSIAFRRFMENFQKVGTHLNNSSFP